MSSHESGTAAATATGPWLPSAPLAEQLMLGCDVSGGGATVIFTGELDMASADRAFCYVCDVIDRCRTAVVMDLAGLSFCDARGLAALLRMSRYAEQAGTSLRLMSPSRQLLQILRITGLGGKLRVTNGLAPRLSNRAASCGYKQIDRTSEDSCGLAKLDGTMAQLPAAASLPGGGPCCLAQAR